MKFVILASIFLCFSVSGETYLSIFHERSKDDFEATTFDGSLALSKRLNVGVSLYRAEDAGLESQTNELNSTYTIDKDWFDIRGSVRKIEEGGGLEGKGASVGGIFLLSHFWAGKLDTTLIVDGTFTKYDQESSRSTNNVNLIFTTDFSQTEFQFTLEQMITKDLIVGLEYSDSAYDDASLFTGSSSVFSRLNFSVSANGINGYPDYRAGGYLQYYLNDWANIELNYSETTANEGGLNSENFGVFLGIEFTRQISSEISYFKVTNDIVFETYGLRLSLRI